MQTLEDVVLAIRAELADYVAGPFADTDHFSTDLHLLSDDQTAIALAVEKRLGVRLDRQEYQHIFNVLTFAKALHSKLSSGI